MLGHRRIPALLGPVADEGADQKQHRHRREDRPALPRVPHHLAEHVRQSRAEDKDQQHLDQVRQAASDFRTDARSSR